MTYRPIAAYAGLAGQWATVALGVSIPISVALDNILLALIAILWLASGELRAKAAVVRRNPVAIAALVLFALLAAGMAHGSGTVDGLAKYVDLLFVPVFITFFQDERTRNRAIAAFCLAAIASVVVSHLAYQNLLTHSSLVPREQTYPTGFKGSITHSMIVALSVYIFALLARREADKLRRAGYIALAVIAAHNVVFMGFGRTGYLVLALMLLYFFGVTFGRRGLLAITVLAAATFATAYLTSGTFHTRMDDLSRQVTEWKTGERAETSVGLRLEFYATSLGIIREHPLIGTGTGSFPAEYAHAVAGRNMVATENPHNEYLLIAVQIGLLGLASLAYLFYAQWRMAGQLAEPYYRDLGRGLVIAFAVGCLFNSLLLDHTEGLLFAWMSALVFASPLRPAPARAP